MAKGKLAYVNRRRKQAIRDEFIRAGKFTTILTLLGPSPIIAIEELVKAGFKKIISWENDPKVFQLQNKEVSDYLKNHPDIEIILNFGDITQAEVLPNQLNDLDLCGLASSLTPDFEKFKKNVLLTVTTRKMDIGKTIDHFCKAFNIHRNGQAINHNGRNKGVHITIPTTDGTFIARGYRDGSPMLTIGNI